jgi:hypothetical protein
VATLGDYIRHLQEVDKQPNKSSESNKPSISCKFCYDIGYDASGQQCTCAEQPSNTDGNKRCPDSGRICNERDCPGDKCLGDKDGFADNIDYIGNPIPTPKRESAKCGWPCVVVGAIPETWSNTSECVSGSEHSAGHTEQHTDAGLNNDGPVATTKL